MDEVGSATDVLEATQQLSNAIGVAVPGTIFSTAFSSQLPTHALARTAWACRVPLGITFLLVFRLPMRVREKQARSALVGAGHHPARTCLSQRAERRPWRTPARAGRRE